MTGFPAKVAAVTGLPPDRIQPLASGSLSEVLLVCWPDGRRSVAKSGPDTKVEAAMLRVLADAGAPAPKVEDEQGGVLLLEYVENDGALTGAAWTDIGARLRLLHESTGPAYGWSVDYAFGEVRIVNRETSDWPAFWAEQRLVPTASMLSGDWRRRVERLCARITELLPARPPPTLLHGDLWTGNLLVNGGRLAALIDPACYYGHAEVDLAMLDLFGAPPEAFHESYGPLEPRWQERRAIYQLFPALVHLRLFGSGYAGMVDRLLTSVGV